MALYSSPGEHCQPDVVTNPLYNSDHNLCPTLPLLHNVWQGHPGNVVPPPLNNTILQQQSQLEYAQTPGIHLHSPVPVSRASWPIISPDSSALRDSPYGQGTNPEPKHPAMNDEPDLLQVYANVPRETFPTPSELLNKATSKQKSINASAKPGRKTEKKVETQRKALQRVLQESIGFSPTDPYVPPRSDSSLRFQLTYCVAIRYPRMTKSVIIWSVLSNISRTCTNNSAWLGMNLLRSSAYQPIAGLQAAQ
jgi:hypothetical protein